MTWIAPEVERLDGPFTGDERSTLDAYLDCGRATLLHKCSGLTGEHLARRSVPPSRLSLLGLIRHMTKVERIWFRQRFAEQDVPSIHHSPDRADVDFEELEPDQAEPTYQQFVAECELARAAIRGRDLEDTFVHHRYGPMSLRWMFCHMITEYERHNGHADLLRESIDGRTGA